MSATGVIGAEHRPADKPKSRTLIRQLKASRELRAQLREMHSAARPFLTDEARKAYWAKSWELNVLRAATRVESNRKQFYGLRLAVVISAITVPSLVGLNLSGTGGTAVRWLTFGLSLIAALAAAISALFRFADRWLMYRTFSNSLMNAGWALINSTESNEQAWKDFTTATETAKASCNVTYTRAVILAAEPKPNGRNGT